MIGIRYPEPEFKIRREAEKEFIFDPLRKKWVALTPEEWVRQNFIQYLLKVKQYPREMIAIEKEIRLGEMKKRFDLLVYSSGMKPWMLIECKSGDVKLDDKVLGQIIRYHAAVPVSFLIITNGNFCFGFSKMNNTLIPLAEIPEYGS